MNRLKELTEIAKDKAVFFGLNSHEYALSVHEMNDYFLINCKKSFFELIKIGIKKHVEKWQQRNRF